jgi:predicted GIY-YIG superfamily endonuclease
LNIEVVWRTPVDLRVAPEGVGQDYIVPASANQRLPEAAGVYVFCRRFGEKYQPLYIGQADNLRRRIGQHLKSNVALMRAMRDAKSGTRAILFGEVITKRGQQIERVLKVVEETLIAEAVESGFGLVNRQLTSAKFHSIVFGGPTKDRGPFDRSYSVPIT